MESQTSYGDSGVDPKANENAILLAATNGHLDEVKYLWEERGCRPVLALIEAAAANNHLNIIEYIHSCGCDLAQYYSTAIKIAISNKSFDVAKYLYETVGDSNKPPKNYCEVTLAASTGYLKMIEYFCCNHKCEDCKNASYLALGNNHSLALEYLLRQYHTSPEELVKLLGIATVLKHSSCAVILMKRICEETSNSWRAK